MNHNREYYIGEKKKRETSDEEKIERYSYCVLYNYVNGFKNMIKN